MKQTANYQLNQWEKTDRIQMEDFNADNAKIDAALKAEADARAAAATANCYVKLMDITLETECQKWDIDISGIDLRDYQKLEIHPHLMGDNNQWVTMYTNNDMTYSFGMVPMINDTTRQNFGRVSYTLLLEMPRIYVIYEGVWNKVDSQAPINTGYAHPPLADDATHLNTLNLHYADSTYHLLPGSTIQIYGLKR